MSEIQFVILLTQCVCVFCVQLGMNSSKCRVFVTEEHRVHCDVRTEPVQVTWTSVAKGRAMAKTVKSRPVSTRGQFVCNRMGQYVSFPHHHHHHHHHYHPIMLHIHRHLNISVLLTAAQAGEDNKKVNAPSNTGGQLDRLQTLSGRPRYRWKDDIKIDIEGID